MPNALQKDLDGFNIVIVPGPDGSNPLKSVDEADEEDENWQWHNEDGDYLIWPENWPTWICFLQLATQWDVVGTMAGTYYQGIPVDRIDRVLARARLTPDDEHVAWHALRDMEITAKNVLNQKLKDAAK